MSNIIPVPQRQPTSPSVTFGEMERLADSIARSGLFGMKTKEQALALMAIAQAEGRHPALAARDYDIIQGRPAKKAEVMLRDFIECGGKVEWHQLGDTIADATFSHPAGGTVRITWDLDRAKTAGLSAKDNYKKFPRQMLRSRCVSEGVRTVYPAATSGMYVPEEVADFDNAPRSASAPPPAPPLAPPPAPKAESKTDIDAAMAWAKGFAEEIKAAASTAAVDQLVANNADRLDRLRDLSPKGHARIIEIIAGRKSELDVPSETQPLSEADERALDRQTMREMNGEAPDMSQVDELEEWLSDQVRQASKLKTMAGLDQLDDMVCTEIGDRSDLKTRWNEAYAKARDALTGKKR